jgi:septal ring factor EnvC (AmiA/AmiB activator)
MAVGSSAGAIPEPARPRSDTPTVAEATERAEATDRRLEEVEQRLEQLEAERAQIEADHTRLTSQQADLARRLEETKRDLRQMAVTAYIAGGPAGNSGLLLQSSELADMAWRSGLIDGQTEMTLQSARHYTQLLASADSAVRELVQRSDQNRAKIEQANLDRFLAGIADKEAERQLADARRRAVVVASTGTPVEALVAADDSNASGWARLRACESGGNYQAVSASGRYRGAYQFDQRTWESVGGVGDPAAAPPEEQDARAKMLYSRRGRSPWPVCGRYLP